MNTSLQAKEQGLVIESGGISILNRALNIKEIEMRKFKLPELPYANDALSGLISPETFEYHLGKHHKAYVDKMNSILESDSSYGDQPTLEELVQKTEGGLYNQAGQSWNHTFYWHSMSPSPTEAPGDLKAAIDKSFGSMKDFKTQFVEKAMGNFGSGWTWLVKNSKNELEIVNTSNAENPLRQGKTPLLVTDVWEHAYYIDHRNARKAYLDKFVDHVNWSFVGENFAGSGAPNMTKFMV